MSVFWWVLGGNLLDVFYHKKKRARDLGLENRSSYEIRTRIEDALKRSDRVQRIYRDCPGITENEVLELLGLDGSFSRADFERATGVAWPF